ncbi:MAG: hypothetical protein N2444_11295 [Methylocystis sp.]|nr:hypothetical protein [Methylocystis sp.]
MSDIRTSRNERGSVRAAVGQLTVVSLIACLCSVWGAKYLTSKFGGGQFMSLSNREIAARRLGVDHTATATIPDKGAFAQRTIAPCGEFARR